MDFQVNDFMTINDFELLGAFETHLRFGEPHEYERFKGSVMGKWVTGLRSTTTNNIYGLKYD